MCVLIFFVNLSVTFLILRRIERDVVINVRRYLCEVRGIFCHILTTLVFSRQVFEKYSNIKFHENLSSGSRVAQWGQTDKQTDMTQLIL